MGSFSVFPVAGLLLKKPLCQLFANFLGNQIRCHAASGGTTAAKIYPKTSPRGLDGGDGNIQGRWRSSTFLYRFEGALLISSTVKDVKDVCPAARIAIVD
jgi:hypothetical protein